MENIQDVVRIVHQYDDKVINMNDVMEFALFLIVLMGMENTILFMVY